MIGRSTTSKTAKAWSDKVVGIVGKEWSSMNSTKIANMSTHKIVLYNRNVGINPIIIVQKVTAVTTNPIRIECYC